MYKIGEMSRLCQIPVQTLRYYDAEGLLTPDRVDPFTGYRYYSATKLALCYRILALKELDFSLDEIKRHLAANTTDDIIRTLEEKRSDLELQLQSTKHRLRRLESLENSLIGGKKMYDIIVRKREPLALAGQRQIFHDKEDALSTAKTVEMALSRYSAGGRVVIINYETEYRESNFDLAACVELTSPLPSNAGYTKFSVNFTHSTATLICPTDELPDGYAALTHFADENRYQIIGSFIEIYHHDGMVELIAPVCASSEKKYEETEMPPFVDDPAVLGRWTLLDILKEKEQFLYDHPKCSHGAWLNELYFIDGGMGYWAVNGWTCGFLFTYGYPGKVYRNRYTVEEWDGHTLLFLEMRDVSGDSELVGEVPEIWVYEKSEDHRYTSPDEIRRKDFTDYPFIPDDSVLGVWKVKDFVVKQDDFSPDTQNTCDEALYARQLEFSPDGSLTLTTREGVSHQNWTAGRTVCKQDATSALYEICEINGTAYLIWEWKSGDYSFGGGRIYYYVFTR